MDQRFVDLEERIAYQAKTIADLDGVVLEFTRRIEALERVVQELRREIEKGREPMEPHDTRPPHY